MCADAHTFSFSPAETTTVLTHVKRVRTALAEKNKEVATEALAEGVADKATLDKLEGEGRVALRYCDAHGKVSDASNPNGAQRNIAGIINETGRVLGMMPHPERLYEAALGGTDGRRVFESALLSVLEAA